MAVRAAIGVAARGVRPALRRGVSPWTPLRQHPPDLRAPVLVTRRWVQSEFQGSLGSIQGVLKSFK